nr:class E basic helix-loop-helix protein 41-like [Camelus dromedarius]
MKLDSRGGGGPGGGRGGGGSRAPGARPGRRRRVLRPDAALLSSLVAFGGGGGAPFAARGRRGPLLPALLLPLAFGRRRLRAALPGQERPGEVPVPRGGRPPRSHCCTPASRRPPPPPRRCGPPPPPSPACLGVVAPPEKAAAAAAAAAATLLPHEVAPPGALHPPHPHGRTHLPFAGPREPGHRELAQEDPRSQGKAPES